MFLLSLEVVQRARLEVGLGISASDPAQYVHVDSPSDVRPLHINGSEVIPVGVWSPARGRGRISLKCDGLGLGPATVL